MAVFDVIAFDGDDTTLWVAITRSTADDLTVADAAIVIITTGVTTAARLAQVDDAITRCLQAQSSTDADATVTLAALAELRSYRRQLAAALAEEAGTCGRVATADLRDNF